MRDSDDPRRFDTRGGPRFAAQLLAPVPPTEGTHRDYAWRLIVQAAAGLVRNAPTTLVDSHRAFAPPDLPESEFEAELLATVRSWACRQVAALAEHGDQIGGVSVAPFEALRATATTKGARQRSGEPEPDSPKSSPSAAPARPTPARPKRRAVKLQASERDLAKAVKYIISSAMELRIAVLSTHPLKLTLVPGAGYEGRFDAILIGNAAAGPRAASQTVMLRFLLETVESLDVDRARRWLPSVAWDRLHDPDVEEHATATLLAELRRRVVAKVLKDGATLFLRYAAGTN